MLKNQKECYLCGAQATTRDHIPPAGLFPVPRPDDLITVPACDRCNQERKLDDEYFRFAVAAGSNDSHQSLTVLHQRILPRARKKPALAIKFLKSLERTDVYSQGGIYLGQGSKFQFEAPRIQAVIDKIVKGLFYEHTGHRLTSNCIVGKFLYNQEISPELQNTILELPLVNIGDGSVFSYRYHIPDAVGCESYWFLMFYDDSSLFIADTQTPSEK